MNKYIPKWRRMCCYFPRVKNITRLMQFNTLSLTMFKKDCLRGQMDPRTSIPRKIILATSADTYDNGHGFRTQRNVVFLWTHLL